MSSIANLGSSAPAGLPQLNIHPHGHKKGAPALSNDLLSSDTSAQLPVPAAQNLFSNLLQSLEQAIGLSPATPAAPGAAAAPKATVTAGTVPAAGATAAALPVGTAATNSAQSANTLLQSYLHNAPQNVRAELQNLASSKVSLNA